MKEKEDGRMGEDEKRTDALLGGKLREMALSCIWLFLPRRGVGFLRYEFTVD